MRRLFKTFIVVMFPWLVFLMDDNPGAAFIALLLQATLIGWPVAVIWAWGIQFPPEKNKKKLISK